MGKVSFPFAFFKAKFESDCNSRARLRLLLLRHFVRLVPLHSRYELRQMTCNLCARSAAPLYVLQLPLRREGLFLFLFFHSSGRARSGGVSAAREEAGSFSQCTSGWHVRSYRARRQKMSGILFFLHPSAEHPLTDENSVESVPEQNTSFLTLHCRGNIAGFTSH